MLTNRAKYAIKALLHLARKRGEGPVGAGVIAESEHIPLKFLELILLQLRNHGLIRSKVGKGGGHEMVKEPEEITLLMVVRVIDGPVAPLPCLSHTAYQQCDDCDDEKTCGTRRLFKTVHDAAIESMSSMTLADAVRVKPSSARKS
jgi:Rrf2 family protein